MTVKDVVSYLIEFFRKQDTFSIKKHKKDLNLITDLDDSIEDGIIRSALSILEKENIVMKANSETWALVDSFENITQTVFINGQNAVCISDIVNNYAKETEIDYESNPLQIKDQDISVLIEILANLANIKE